MDTYVLSYWSVHQMKRHQLELPKEVAESKEAMAFIWALVKAEGGTCVQLERGDLQTEYIPTFKNKER